MAQLSLALTTFGGLEIRQGGQLLTNLGSRKAEALLVYLAYTNRPASRETLAALLWGDAPQANALASLSVALNQLRKRLAPFITAERHTVTFNQVEDTWLDTAVLEEGLLAWHRHSQGVTAVSPDDIAHLEKTLAIYRGDFLAGFAVRDGYDFEAWALLERERLRHLVTTALAELIQLCHDDGRYGAGIAQARRMLTIEPLREDAHQLLMLMLARQGQWSAALAQYQRCQVVLATELGVEPIPETTNLYERIRLAAQQPRHNLPAQSTSFIGREIELRQIREQFTKKKIRLLIIIGTGGIGKTRLAQQAGWDLQPRFLNGICFTDLATAQNPEQVIQKIALSLGIEGGEGGQTKSLLERVTEMLHQRELLLILDNCEHQVDICAEVAQRVLRECPDISLLITSRERLGVIGEIIWETPAMSMPTVFPAKTEEQATVLASDAIRLFAERAQIANPDFTLNQETLADVHHICQHLEGIPLAIELAASRLHVLSLVEIRNRLGDRFHLLVRKSRGGLRRQQTLLATIEWSYDLLSPEEQLLFERLSLFRNGFNLEAVEAICTGNGLKVEKLFDLFTSLVDKSLVISRESTSESRRFGMLEMLREFGQIKLASRATMEALRKQYALYFLSLAEKAYPELDGPRQAWWGERLHVEYENIRSALEWTIQKREVETAVRLGAVLWHGVWLKRGYYREGRHYLELIDNLSQGIKSGPRGLVILGRGALAAAEADYNQAKTLFQRSLALGEALDDITLIAWSIHHNAEVNWIQGNLKEAKTMHQQSLVHFRQINDQIGIAWELYHLALIAENLGNFQEAKELLTESLQLHRKQGNKWAIAWALGLKGRLILDEGDYAAARQLFQEVLDINQELKSKRGQVYAYVGLGDAASLENSYENATLHYQMAYDMARQIGDGSWIILSQFYLARTSRLLGMVRRTEPLLEQALNLAIKNKIIFVVIRGLAEYACLARLRGELQKAATLFGAAEAIQQKRSPYGSPLYEGEIALTKAAMGEQAFNQAWEHGSTMTWETAVAYAQK